MNKHPEDWYGYIVRNPKSPTTLVDLKEPYRISKGENTDTVLVQKNNQTYYFQWKPGISPTRRAVTKN